MIAFTHILSEVPFLPVRDDFHPKRNQARQKLATLPKTRFKDLSGDVFHELGRRYPEFKEPEVNTRDYHFCNILTKNAYVVREGLGGYLLTKVEL